MTCDDKIEIAKDRVGVLTNQGIVITPIQVDALVVTLLEAKQNILAGKAARPKPPEKDPTVFSVKTNMCE